MNATTESIVFNAVPLLLVAAAYFGVAVALLPAVWRQREELEALDLAVVAVFPLVGLAAAALGALVIRDERPLGGHIWIVLAAVPFALLPVAAFARRFGDRALVAGGVHRARVAEERISLRDREIEALAAIAAALTRAPTLAGAALPLVEKVRELLGVEFAAVVVVDENAEQASGVVALLEDDVVPWWPDLELELRREPSGIASAVFDAAPVTVYDVQGSPRVSRRLVQMVGAKSGAWIPIVASDHVVGVLIAATTRAKRVFAAEELSLLQTLAAETAMALDRMRAAAALEQALDRERRSAAIGRRIRAEHEGAEATRAAALELEQALAADSVTVEVGPGEQAGIPGCSGGTRYGTIRIERAEPLADAEVLLSESVARELGLALERARLVDEHRRRLVQHSGLLQAARIVTGPLDLEIALDRLLDELTGLLDVDAADCYLCDGDCGFLRCVAVRGLDPALVGFSFPRDEGLAGLALRRERPVASDLLAQAAPVPHEAYARFTSALVAPLLSGGSARGVLGVASADPSRCFDRDECELLEAFAGLASVAIRAGAPAAPSAPHRPPGRRLVRRADSGVAAQ